MPRNGSGVMTPDVDFTTEAASPPIEIAKLDQAIDDICDELTNSLSADGQTLPTQNIPMNGKRLTGLGAATALTDAARVTEIIDQDYVFYVDSGSANTYVITPSPAISAYEEGQRFVFRATNANSGASTLNVNGLGAIAIQTPDGVALASGAIVSGGYYEVVYDANATPDRWVLMSPPSAIPLGMISGVTASATEINLLDGLTGTIWTSTNDGASSGLDADTLDGVQGSDYARLSQNNTFTGTSITLSNASNPIITVTDTDGVSGFIQSASTLSQVLVGSSTNHAVGFYTNSTEKFVISNAGNYNFKGGTVTTAKASASEVGTIGIPRVSKTADYTIAAADAGTELVLSSAADDITVQASGQPAAGMVVFLENNTGGSVDIIQGTSMTLTLDGTSTTGSRTLAANGRAYIRFTGSGTACVGGLGVA